MPRRALFSLLLALTGTLIAPAAPAGFERGQPRFQPGRNMPAGVLTPAGLGVVRPSAQRIRAVVIRPTSQAFAPGRVSILKPAASAVRPAASGRKP